MKRSVWIGIALLLLYIVGVNYESHSAEGKARSATAFRGAVREIGSDVCDAYDWARKASECEGLAAEARDRARRRFESYQR